MSDPWNRAADGVSARDRRRRQEDEARQYAEQLEAAAREDALRADQNERERKIAAATREIERILQRREVAAKRLFAAINSRPDRNVAVNFGRHNQGGGSAVAVIFDENGIRRVIGSGVSSYGGRERFEPGTPRDAAHAAVVYSKMEPGTIAKWFEEQVDGFANLYA